MTQAYYPPPPPPPSYYGVKPPLNAMAVVSLITGLLGMAILPVVLGHFAMATIKNTGQRGATAAVIGLVLGYIQTAAYAFALIAGFFGS